MLGELIDLNYNKQQTHFCSSHLQTRPNAYEYRQVQDVVSNIVEKRRYPQAPVRPLLKNMIIIIFFNGHLFNVT